jgi:hypothetical protein
MVYRNVILVDVSGSVIGDWERRGRLMRFLLALQALGLK